VAVLLPPERAIRFRGIFRPVARCERELGRFGISDRSTVSHQRQGQL